MIKEGEIYVSQLLNKWVTEEYIKSVGCFMQSCNGRSLYAKDTGGSHVFHCNLHKGADHKRIIFGK